INVFHEPTLEENTKCRHRSWRIDGDRILLPVVDHDVHILMNNEAPRFDFPHCRPAKNGFDRQGTFKVRYVVPATGSRKNRMLTAEKPGWGADQNSFAGHCIFANSNRSICGGAKLFSLMQKRTRMPRNRC